jgi:hypothetical protein
MDLNWTKWGSFSKEADNRASHDNAVGKHLDGDFAAGVLVIAVCDGVDEGLP